MHRAEAEQFYRELKGKQVRVGIEATGHSRWFERFTRMSTAKKSNAKLRPF